MLECLAVLGVIAFDIVFIYVIIDFIKYSLKKKKDGL